MITKEQVIKALSLVEDPDLKKDLVTLGMIKDLEVEGNKISFTVMLTTPSCPLKEVIKKDCEISIRQLVSHDAEINIKMDADVTSLRTNENVLPNVKNIIAV